ncbi:hypothetical protein CCHL11_05183 [Colletotrichum chlorophyti]|uniref:Uncharacterized protein n=1 Tax=Colletotrichum chlorophyti TaxID=708187 RepID=A0A1Q8RP70_9PEZI|nr:hypothetical protein CCHL11_05183 [Colletotrichum chlorophyti]
MGRFHRRGSDIDSDPYDYPADPYDQYPTRGRSPAPRRRNRSEPAAAAAAATAVHNDTERHTEPRQRRDSRRHHKDDPPQAYIEPRQDRKSHGGRDRDREIYYDDDAAYARRAHSHGRSAREYGDFDAYAPASRRGRDRQHAYHPPRTSDTRRHKYPGFEPESSGSDKRRSRYADYDDPHVTEPRRPRHQEYDEPRLNEKRRSRYADYEGVPRSVGEPDRDRYADYDAGRRRRVNEHHAAQGRGRWSDNSPNRYAQPNAQRTARGRSMPRSGGGRGGVATGRPRAKSAVGYAALGEAAQTAFRVGSQAAYQMRKEPGPWIGEKGTRVATAALGAALVDTFVGHKASNMKGGMRHQALRQACELGIRNFVMQPAVNTASRHASGFGGGGEHGNGRRRR